MSVEALDQIAGTVETLIETIEKDEDAYFGWRVLIEDGDDGPIRDSFLLFVQAFAFVDGYVTDRKSVV